jgi:Cu(I)-responsive transcriptional regulator
MNIGQASKATGISTKMIRHYESIRLISPALRTGSGYRVYQEPDIHALRFISSARDLGFSIEQMRDLLTLWRDRSRASSSVKAVALEHIRVLEDKAEALRVMSRSLRHLADHCHGDNRPDCPIIEEFAEARTRPPRARHRPKFGIASVPIHAHRQAGGRTLQI